MPHVSSHLTFPTVLTYICSIITLSYPYLHFVPLLHLPACHPSCQTCAGPSQADCTSCPPMVSLQNGYCRTSCQEGHFLNAVTRECLSKSACVCASMFGCFDGVMHISMSTVQSFYQTCCHECSYF